MKKNQYIIYKVVLEKKTKEQLRIHSSIYKLKLIDRNKNYYLIIQNSIME
jgi:hypothetical protein